MRQNSESSTLFSRGFWHDVFSKGRSLSLSHIEQAGVEQERPAAHALSSSAGLTPAARGVQPGMCVSVGPGFPSLGPGVPPAAMSAPAASPAAACLDVPGADGGGGGEPPPPGQAPDKASGAGVTTVTSFVGSSRRHRLVRSQECTSFILT
ncbi:uncharacterized protein LOC124553355 [Schistocerca americana]|uniref:uncharacterized protein LOC124553355 n=1 Tax=Schistocerca americana TaxID=7009 RepID=UPI001F4FEDCA|nr:uncharacterized protein LOC124553355 [Schistocerca americana]